MCCLCLNSQVPAWYLMYIVIVECVVGVGRMVTVTTWTSWWRRSWPSILWVHAQCFTLLLIVLLLVLWVLLSVLLSWSWWWFIALIIIMYIYHALINALSAHMIHINLNMIFYTHVEHSPTKTIYIKYYTEKQTNICTTHTHTHTHASMHVHTHTCMHTCTHTHTQWL